MGATALRLALALPGPGSSCRMLSSLSASASLVTTFPLLRYAPLHLIDCTLYSNIHCTALFGPRRMLMQLGYPLVHFARRHGIFVLPSCFLIIDMHDLLLRTIELITTTNC